MNNIILPASLPKSYSYEILGDLQATVVVRNNPYNIPLDALFLMAARKNTKRSFLFVSKVLGKHIPVHPLIPFIAGAALAGRYASLVHHVGIFEEKCDFSEAFVNPAVLEETWEYVRQNPLPLPEKTLFIGFAETATALGHSVFASFAENAQYIHTTRENIVGISNVFNFAEEHSHAVEHYCYGLDMTLFDNQDRIVLVDDEITTGKSALNFIKAIQHNYPRKNYAVISLLDWRSTADKEILANVEAELGICIQMISLVGGDITVQGEPIIDYQPLAQLTSRNDAPMVVENIIIEEDLGGLVKFFSVNTSLKKNKVPYLYGTGRFGISSKEQVGFESKFQKVGLSLGTKRKGERTLCLGTGEFMYIPFKIASFMGTGVRVQSTTRSPVYPVQNAGYGVQQAISFACPEDQSIVNYVYNIPVDYYDEVFIFLERVVDITCLSSLLQAFAPLGISNIHCISCVSEIE